jgi:hypothetical protein
MEVVSMLTTKRAKRIVYAASVGAADNWAAVIERNGVSPSAVRVVIRVDGDLYEAFEVNRNAGGRALYHAVRESCRYCRFLHVRKAF